MTDESMTRCPPYYVVPGLTLDDGRPVDFVRLVHALNLNHQMGNVLKYVIRAGRKPGVDYAKDVRKIMWCAVSELERIGDGISVGP